MKDIDIDGEDMNFTNPTGLSELEQIPQLKMLHCQLKEYQLKGLRCVSVKQSNQFPSWRHLIENHNAWGSFLTVAPVSILHHREQELTCYVPGLHALPYWGI